MFFHLEEEVEEKDMMDQLMEDERSSKESEEVGEEEGQTDLRQGRGEQLHNGNVHSGVPVPGEEVPKRKSQ